MYDFNKSLYGACCWIATLIAAAIVGIEWTTNLSLIAIVATLLYSELTFPKEKKKKEQ